MGSFTLPHFAQAEENILFLLESFPCAMVASDDEDRIRLVNGHAEKLFGYRREELLGKSTNALMSGGLRGSQPRTFEVKGRRKDGTTFPVAVDRTPVQVEGQTFWWNAIREISESDELEERFKLAIAAGGIGTFDWDLVTGKIVWDGHQERLFGFEPGGFDGTYASFEARVHPDDRPPLNHAIKTARETHTTLAQEFRVLWPDKSIHWIFSRGEFFYDESGKAVRMRGAVVDVDDRKRAELALGRAEERFRNILDSMIEGCLLIDFHWIYLYMNEAAAKQERGERKDLVGRSLLELHPGIEKTDFFSHCRHCMEERLPDRFEANFTISGGETRTYQISVVPVPEGIFVLSLNVTDREHAEQELRRSEERLRQAIRVSNTGIFDHDHSRDLVYWSPEQYEMYGVDPSTPITVAEYLSRVHPEDRERIAAAVRQAHDPAGDGFFDIEHRLVRPDGTVRWTSIRSQTFFAGVGKDRHPVRTVGAANDITERKQAEADKTKLETQLFQAQKMESIGRLAGGVAHDFNNLLTVINGYTDLLLQRTTPNDPAEGPLNEIKKAGQRATELTQQLLAFGRKQITMPKVLNLNHLIWDVENLLRRLIGEDIALVTVLSPDLGHVIADPGQLVQVLMNLAANGRDAMPNGGGLRIETANIELDDRYASEHPEATPGAYVRLTVIDSGSGMDAETRAHLFEPFFTTKRVGEGTGLGLATVYGAVKQAGGFIRVYSEPGRGSTFKIYLHRAQDAVETEAAPPPSMGTLHGTETILLVEDQPELRQLARTILESHGYEVLEAPDAEKAIDLSERWSGHIHLMVTDVVMPGMNGWELANRMKTLRPEMKVIYMSGYAASASPGEIREAGIDYLQKPLAPDDLVSKVREVLERSG